MKIQTQNEQYNLWPLAYTTKEKHNLVPSNGDTPKYVVTTNNESRNQSSRTYILNVNKIKINFSIRNLL